MPLNPSSYSKIFKSKYVQDDDDETDIPQDNAGCHDTDGTSSSYIPATYSNPKVQELLSKPKPNFDKIFSSRYIDEGASYQSKTVRSCSVEPKSYTPIKDYDKIFTSKYLNDDVATKPQKRRFNPYLTEDDDDVDSEPIISHLPPSRSSSIRRSVPPPRYNSYNEPAPFTPSRRSFESKPLRNLIVSRSVTPSSIRSESSPARSVTTRRFFPQDSPSTYNLDDLTKKEESPVVFDANLTFILGCKSQMKQNVKAVPAHLETDTQSSALSSKIADFLNRTDHVMQEWQSVGKKRKNDTNLTGRSKSATNIMIKGFQLYSKANSMDRSRGSENGDTQNEIDEVFLPAKNPKSNLE